MSASDLIRTNIRMPRELHSRLKRAALDQNETVEAFATKILKQALLSDQAAAGDAFEASSRTPAERKQFLSWAAQLRHQADEIERTATDSPGTLLDRLSSDLARSAPIPMVVKDDANRIVTANPAYLRLLFPAIHPEAALSRVRGQTLKQALGMKYDGPDDEEKFAKSISESFEHLHIQDRNINVLALRFLFEVSAPGAKFYFGDISFETQHLIDARASGHFYPKEPPPPPINEPPAPAFLWSAYFRNMTTPALIKEVQGRRIVWANRSFVNLVGEFCERMQRPLPSNPIGKTSLQLFGDNADQRLEDYDSMAARGVPMLGVEMLRAQERIGARFPIYTGSREIEYIGIVSSSAGRFPRGCYGLWT